MALYDLARMTTPNVGVASLIALGAALPGFLSFALAGVPDGAKVSVAISDTGGSPTQSLVGRGIYSAAANAVNVTSITASTNAGAMIPLSGSAQIAISPIAADFAPAAFGSVTEAKAATLTADTEYVRTAGYSLPSDFGGALYTRAVGSTPGGFQSLDGQWWQLAMASVTPEMFGAKGDNATDDTTAIQNAITVAQAMPKGCVKFRSATYKITSALSMTSGISLEGSGYNTTYKAKSGTQIAVYGTINGLNIVTDDTFFIEKIGFYANTPGNCTLVSINTDNTSSTNCSTCSVIRDCFFQNAFAGIQATSIGLFIFDNLQFWNCTAFSLQADIFAASAGGGDCTLTNSTFSGAPSQGHFRTGTLGGMRIVNNKFNCSGGINAIVFVGTIVSAASMSPLIIANNSIEGAAVGISLLRVGLATIALNNFAFTGNEIACTGNSAAGIQITGGGGNTNQWVTGGVISGNLISINNGTGLVGINLDAAADITIGANQFTANAACTSINLGANVARINVLAGSNGKGLNVT